MTITQSQILRVGARNNAAFEWIQHEIVGRDEGLTTEQLAVVRDTSRCGTANSSLSALHLAGLAFADSMTQTVKVPDAVYDKLRHELSKNLPQDVNVDQQMVEAAATVGTYNRKSCFPEFTVFVRKLTDTSAIQSSPASWSLLMWETMQAQQCPFRASSEKSAGCQ